MNKIWTGERLETFVTNEVMIDHLHRYAIACTMCKNRDVLDIACGEGYGSMLMSKEAGSVTGVDISKETIAEARQKYKKSNLAFQEGSASDIPLPPASVDLVVSFETLEHHDKHAEMMREIKRVLRPKGVLLMSSPEKKYYSDVPNYKNPFHVKELYFEEFKELIRKNFSQTSFFFQKNVAGSLIINETTSTSFHEYGGNYETIGVQEFLSPLYNLCIASDGELPGIQSSLFDGSHLHKLALDHAVSAYKNTWSYKLGHLLLSPLRIFKKN